jgi:hypothetical protein
MKPRTSRVLIAIVASTLLAASLGCGLINQVNQVVNAAQVLSDFADRMNKAATLTYTAEYSMTGGENAGEKVTLVQQPPKAAFLVKDGRFISTPEALFFCGDEKGVMTCQKQPNAAAAAGQAEAGFVAGIAGPGFITPEVALGLILAAAVVPGAKVESSEKKIGGKDALCATASNLEAAASPGEKDVPKDFSVCILEEGVLASFSGTSSEDEKVAIELTSFKESADASAFAPPAGAKVVDVTSIEPPK